MQRNFGTFLHQNAFCSEIVQKNALCSETLVRFYTKTLFAAKFVFCFFVHKNALCSAILVHFYTKTLFAAKFAVFFIVHKNTLCRECFVPSYCTHKCCKQLIFLFLFYAFSSESFPFFNLDRQNTFRPTCFTNL